MVEQASGQIDQGSANSAFRMWDAENTPFLQYFTSFGKIFMLQ